MMRVEQVVDWVLLLALLWVSLDQAWTTLRRTWDWDFLSRAYLLFFLGKSTLWIYVVWNRIVNPPPAVLHEGGWDAFVFWGIRAILVSTGLLMVYALRRYQWSDPPPRIQWASLFGRAHDNEP